MQEKYFILWRKKLLSTFICFSESLVITVNIKNKLLIKFLITRIFIFNFQNEVCYEILLCPHVFFKNIT